jgi:hypothetical protein
VSTDKLIEQAEKNARYTNNNALMRSQTYALLAIATELKRANDINEIAMRKNR